MAVTMEQLAAVRFIVERVVWVHFLQLASSLKKKFSFLIASNIITI
jgi:hypothetical protein